MLNREKWAVQQSEARYQFWGHSKGRGIWTGIARWIMMGEGHLKQKVQVSRAVPIQMTETRGWIKRLKGDVRKPWGILKARPKHLRLFYRLAKASKDFWIERVMWSGLWLREKFWKASVDHLQNKYREKSLKEHTPKYSQKWYFWMTTGNYLFVY